ncbi:MAG: ABC transporter permease [Acutalibacteraceae bacterium]|nr:ABC transporter permease [Acutalibacteraceae bacterium]
MKQFGKILKFEFKNYLTNKVFVGVTIFLVVLISIIMFFPRILEFVDNGEDTTETEKLPVMLIVSDKEEYSDTIYETFSASFKDYEVKITDIDLENIKKEITSGSAECAFVMSGFTSYTYYVNNLSMYDTNTAIADEALQSIYRMSSMVNSGLSAKEAQAILSTQINHETQTLGKDQAENYFYTYIMIFALYMVILLYGQMVATNVATEKSSRAMELLITSAKPTSMMFGKVIASCLAGFIQLVAIFGSAFVFFNINKEYWDKDGIISSIFDIPFELLIYMLIFFVLGFFIYAFMFGAVGSTASKLEDINTSVMPITMLFIISFMVVMFSLGSNTIDTPLMIVCSYIPFTSPVAMFTRIAMSTVPWYEITISIAILVGSVVGIGIISAKIYRVGVLLYGTTPKISSILKSICKS